MGDVGETKPLELALDNELADDVGELIASGIGVDDTDGLRDDVLALFGPSWAQVCALALAVDSFPIAESELAYSCWATVARRGRCEV